ncbi:MAG: hypothetical protein WA887_00475 [Carnobacterium jeotgali]|uniref:hypothetical protein n=1 Tax=Carnobacterium jeotgali TaxID=545534 RepID=UPI003C75264D
MKKNNFLNLRGDFNEKAIFFGLYTNFFLAGCSTISPEEAEQLVIDQYSNFNGTAEIISTDKKEDKYYIEWINESDGTKGVSAVSSDGKIIVIEAEAQ